jgi:hypothetical protein
MKRRCDPKVTPWTTSLLGIRIHPMSQILEFEEQTPRRLLEEVLV